MKTKPMMRTAFFITLAGWFSWGTCLVVACPNGAAARGCCEESGAASTCAECRICGGGHAAALAKGFKVPSNAPTDGILAPRHGMALRPLLPDSMSGLWVECRPGLPPDWIILHCRLLI